MCDKFIIIFVHILWCVLYSCEIDALPRKHVGENIVEQEVPAGETVVLQCRSNDGGHGFNYWHLEETGDIIGPGYAFDDLKYKYEILSGNLTIRAVSKLEEGLYNCVSGGVVNDDVNIRSTRMIVQQDWEEVYEHDSSVNLFRIVVIITTLVFVSGVGYLAYKMWRNRYRYPRYLEAEDDDDDSGEELFRAPGTSSGSGQEARPPTHNIVLEKSHTAGFDNPSISTDFSSILDTVSNK